MIRSLLALCATSLVCGSAVAGSFNTDAQVDYTFNAPTGWRRAFDTNGGSQDERVVAIARALDGGYVVAGTAPGGAVGPKIFLAKFRPNGTYDATFGGNAGGGRLTKDAYLTNVADMTIDSQGRIVVVGSTPGALGQKDFAAVRFLSNGADDTSFAGDGGVAIPFDRDLANSRANDVGSAVATTPDGSVFVAGTIAENVGGPTTVVGLVKLNPNGTIDDSFGPFGNGRDQYCRAQCSGVISVGRMVYDANNGRLVLGGDFTAGTNNSDWFVAIRQILGAPSSSFYAYAVDYGGNSGVQLAYLRGLAVQPDGKIVAVGYANTQSLAFRSVVMRLKASGSALDTGFGDAGTPGKALIPVDAVDFYDVLPDSAGRLFLVGASDDSHYGVTQRLTPTGGTDYTFGLTGAPTYYAAPVSSNTSAYGTAFKRAFLDAGRLVIGGEASYSTTDYTDVDLIVTRLGNDLIFTNGLE